MKNKNLSSRILTTLCGLLTAVLLMGSLCTKPIDLEPFKELARNADCAEISNRLFLIDKKMVFWERLGNCPDNSFAQTLYGKTPDDVLCSRYDSIGGPLQSCNDQSYQNMFQTMVDNLNQPDLGLGPGHDVEPISF
ncbi:MAG: hypothetical protein ACE5HS_09345 [bacterium]